MGSSSAVGTDAGICAANVPAAAPDGTVAEALETEGATAGASAPVPDGSRNSTRARIRAGIGVPLR
jgi:hypothetical protein